MVDSAVKPRRQSFQNKKPHKEIRFGSYVLGSTLGEGEFGKVKLGWRKDGLQPSQVAIKFIRRDSIPRGSERESKVHREINALKRLSHPNIIKLEEVLQNDKYIGIVLEYASGGELFDYILQHRYLKDSLACRLFAQLVSGVHYMHSKGIVHRDLKLENLLLDKHKNVVITDFGFVNSFTPNNELMKTSCGSPCYAAPELVISNEPYEARKADIWSCGVILYAMLAGYLPFDDDPQNPDGDDISRLYQYITSTHLTFPEYIEPMPRDLLRRMLVPNPKKRIGLKDIRSHQWLAGHAPFLSVTPSEWDINHKTNSLLTSNGSLQYHQQRSHSIPKNDYRRFSLIDTATSSSYQSQSNSTFYSNPLPPQTSSNHAIAIPSSTSSNSINEQVKYTSPRGHKRSSSVQSTASLALQAVVDADEVRYQQQTVLPSSASTYSIDKSSSSLSSRPYSDGKKPVDKPPHLQPQGIPRSTTHTGITTLGSIKNSQLGSYTIEESPGKPKTAAVNTDFAKPKVPIISNPISNQKFPGPGARKPRPTSYHPGLYTASDNNTFDYQFGNQMFTRSESATSITSLNNSKISRPYVDLSSAEGDIIIPKSPLLLNAKTFGNSRSTEKIYEHTIQDLEKSITTINENNEKSNETDENKKQNRYSAVLAAELVIDKIYSSSSPQDPQQVKSSENLAKLDSHVSSIHSKPPSNNSTVTKNTSVNSASPLNQRKVSRGHQRSSSVAPSSNANNSTATRAKRFSFLGFYNFSNENTSSSEIQSNHSKSSNTTKTSTISKAAKKKVLEPSNEANIKNINDNKKNSTVSYTSFAPKKEPSTAKKVMDFFKRRSMRV